MAAPTTDIWDQARARLNEAVRDDGRLGIQVYVSLSGERLWQETFGQYRPGEPLTSAHLMPWMCCSKLLTVLALARLHDRGEISTATRIADVLPEYAAGGKQDVTIEHVLTHTIVYAKHDDPWDIGLRATMDAVCQWPMVAPPGERACYNIFANWLVLSEVIQRITGRDYHELLREEVMAPLGMDTSAFYRSGRLDRGGLPAMALRVLFNRDGDGGLRPVDYPGPDGWPGVETWGPASELARPLECIVADGVWQGRQLVSPEAIRHFCAPVREGVADEFFQGLELSWGRGTNTDAAWYGAPRDARVTGHTGWMTALAVGDLDRRLVVVYLTNTTMSGDPVFFRSPEHLAVGDIYEAAVA
jgi:CubicO group peptidase (beta-lactamase class C family)